jgi:hypothetical protein
LRQLCWSVNMGMVGRMVTSSRNKNYSFITDTTNKTWETHVRGVVCRYPMELTLLSRFLRAANAEDCGKSIRIPYMHLYRYGYFSGSSNCRRRSTLSVSLSNFNLGRAEILHVKTGDSINCTSLSTWMSILTVISNSPLSHSC